jgi:AcrR family transcriptional regulator
MNIKERIEEAALLLFAEQGYKAVRMEDLAEYLGISKKTLYNHFDSKGNLLKEALRRRVGEMFLLLENLAEDKTIEFIPRLKNILETAGGALKFTEVFARDTSIPRDLVGSVFPRLRDHILTLVKNLVDEGISKGFIRTDIPTEILPYIHLDMQLFLQTIIFSGLLTDKGRQALGQGVQNEG